MQDKEEEKIEVKTKSMMPQLIAEFIGTFAIVFFGGWAYLQMEKDPTKFNWSAVAITQGLVQGACVWAAQSISGGFFNWAVTLAIGSLRKITPNECFSFIIVQTLGSLFAGFMIDILTPDSWDTKSITKMGFPKLDSDTYSETVGFFAELIGTGIYMYCVMAFKYDARMPKSIYGITAGAGIMLAIVSIGPITGASLNPARIIGPILITMIFGSSRIDIYKELNVYWFYFLGPIFGALLVGFYYEFFMLEEEEQDLNLSVATYEADDEIDRLKI